MIYTQDFSSGIQPSGWFLRNNEVGSSPANWDNKHTFLEGLNGVLSAKNDPKLFNGIVYKFPQKMTKMYARFKLKYSTTPPVGLTKDNQCEYILWYGASPDFAPDRPGEELCNNYLVEGSRLASSIINGGRNGRIVVPLPANKWINFWQSFTIGTPAVATAAWSLDNQEPKDGSSQFSRLQDGNCPWPVSSILFMYSWYPNLMAMSDFTLSDSPIGDFAPVVQPNDPPTKIDTIETLLVETNSAINNPKLTPQKVAELLYRTQKLI